MSDYVVFPVGKEASADAYQAFCTANNPEPSGTWTPLFPTDKYGQRAVPFLGPTGFIWNNQPFSEPEGGPAARADGVLIANIEWPVVDDV